MGETRIISFPNSTALATAVADAWLAEVDAARQQGRKYLVALSGGRIAARLFTSCVERSRGKPQSLASSHFFWADERCVPPDDEESNYRLALERLIQPLGLCASSVHRIPGELGPDAAARQASAELLRVVGAKLPTIPVLDLVLLGMGEDGHVASLFPGNGAASDKTSLYLPVFESPKPPPHRVSLGHAVITAAREVWVLASGVGKQAALQESLSPHGRTPLAMVLRERKITCIFSDIRLG